MKAPLSDLTKHLLRIENKDIENISRKSAPNISKVTIKIINEFKKGEGYIPKNSTTNYELFFKEQGIHFCAGYISKQKKPFSKIAKKVYEEYLQLQ